MDFRFFVYFGCYSLYKNYLFLLDLNFSIYTSFLLLVSPCFTPPSRSSTRTSRSWPSLLCVLKVGMEFCWCKSSRLGRLELIQCYRWQLWCFESGWWRWKRKECKNLNVVRGEKLTWEKMKRLKATCLCKKKLYVKLFTDKLFLMDVTTIYYVT